MRPLHRHLVVPVGDKVHAQRGAYRAIKGQQLGNGISQPPDQRIKRAGFQHEAGHIAAFGDSDLGIGIPGQFDQQIHKNLHLQLARKNQKNN